MIETYKKLIIKGIDKNTEQEIIKERKKKTQSIDLSPWFNAKTYLNMYHWGRYERPFRLSIANEGDSLRTKLGNFVYHPTAYSFLMIEMGRSDLEDRNTIPTQYSARSEIPVNANTTELNLLYFSENESRNTGARVGKITLIYDDGDSTSIELEVGRNVDFMRAYTAKEVFPLVFDDEFTRIISYSATDNYNRCCNNHLNFLSVPCDSKRLLKSFRIEIVAADSQFGLIGANYLDN